MVPVSDNRHYLPPVKSISVIALFNLTNKNNCISVFALFIAPSQLTQAMSVQRRNSSSGSAPLIEPPLLLMGMATCHSVTIIDGVLSGDPLDLKVLKQDFKMTQYLLN